MEHNANSTNEGRVLFTREPNKENEKRLKNYYLGVLARDLESFLKDLSSFIKSSDVRKSIVLLDILKREKCEKLLLTYRELEDETIFHVVAKYNDDAEIAKKVIDVCPRLLTESRKESNAYRGQTALHIMIAKGNCQGVEAILTKSESISVEFLHKLLRIQAVGYRFANTVMLGQLPLNIAALLYHTSMIDLLLKYGADMNRQNSKGDTVFHCLVKYSAIHLDEVPSVLNTIDYLQLKMEERNKEQCKYIDGNISCQFQHSEAWFLKNGDGYTALQLAAKLGVVDLFQHIINKENVYRFSSMREGLFDVTIYDVTEIDSMSNNTSSLVLGKEREEYSKPNKETPRDHDVAQPEELDIPELTEYTETDSVLRMLFGNNYDCKSAYRFVDLPPVNYLIKEKWKFFRWIYYIWMVIHMWYISSLTVYSIERMSVFNMGNGTSGKDLETSDISGEYRFAVVFQWIAFTVGIFYFMFAVLAIAVIIKRYNALDYFLHNLWFVIMLFAFSVCVIVDTFMTHFSKTHDSIPLILAIVLGWSFSVFFLLCFPTFSFFVEMIKRVMFGDFLRFATILLFHLIAFSTGMFLMFHTEDFKTAKEDSTYGSAMMILFRLVIGREDIGVLSETRVPWLSILLFVTFVVISYFLLLNSLIAMMSQTWAVVNEDKFSIWRIYQLSVILFLEEILRFCYLYFLLPCVGKNTEVRIFTSKSMETKYCTRRFLEMHLLHTKYTTKEGKRETYLSEADDPNILRDRNTFATKSIHLCDNCGNNIYSDDNKSLPAGRKFPGTCDSKVAIRERKVSFGKEKVRFEDQGNNKGPCARPLSTTSLRDIINSDQIDDISNEIYDDPKDKTLKYQQDKESVRSYPKESNFIGPRTNDKNFSTPTVDIHNISVSE